VIFGNVLPVRVAASRLNVRVQAHEKLETFDRLKVLIALGPNSGTQAGKVTDLPPFKKAPQAALSAHCRFGASRAILMRAQLVCVLIWPEVLNKRVLRVTFRALQDFAHSRRHQLCGIWVHMPGSQPQSGAACSGVSLTCDKGQEPQPP
jgi:hypothetical protein